MSTNHDPIRDVLTRWANGEAGALTGSTAPIVENDLRAAARSLSASNWARLPEILDWMDEELPPECYGSSEKRRAWAEKHAR